MYLDGTWKISIFYIKKKHTYFRFGRKFGILTGVLVGVPVATASPFAPTYTVFLVLRCITGAAFQGVYQTSFVMSTIFISLRMHI